MQAGDVFEKVFYVDEEVYEGFIATFGDKNPLHTDAAYAKSKGFLDCVMHGNILNGFLSNFIGESLPQKDVIIHSQEIAYKNPVYLHDKLFFRAVIEAVYESVKVIEFKFTFKDAGNLTMAKGKIQVGLI